MTSTWYNYPISKERAAECNEHSNGSMTIRSYLTAMSSDHTPLDEFDLPDAWKAFGLVLPISFPLPKRKKIVPKKVPKEKQPKATTFRPIEVRVVDYLPIPKFNKRQPQRLPSDEWLRCLDYFEHRCAVCGRPQGLWHILAQDHWIPASRGGLTTSSNIVPLCHSRQIGNGGCNNSKHNCDALKWLTKTLGEDKASQIESRINQYFEWVKSQ